MKTLFTTLNVIFLTVAAYLCADLFYAFGTSSLRTNLEIAPPAIQTTEAKRPSIPPESRYASIYRNDLFHTKRTSEPSPPREKVDIASLQQTSLELVLWGTIVDVDGRSYAVIEEKKSRKQQLYRAGDQIQNAKVKMILRQQVVLNVNGKDEVLQMEKPRPGRTVMAQAQSSPAPVAADRDITIERETVESAVGNIASFLRQVRIRPYFENGKPAGLKLSNVAANSLFTRMGLQSNDIIKGVNGNSVLSMDDAIRFYRDLKDAQDGNLQILRNGSEQTINYSIQ